MMRRLFAMPPAVLFGLAMTVGVKAQTLPPAPTPNAQLLAWESFEWLQEEGSTGQEGYGNLNRDSGWGTASNEAWTVPNPDNEAGFVTMPGSPVGDLHAASPGWPGEWEIYYARQDPDTGSDVKWNPTSARFQSPSSGQHDWGEPNTYDWDPRFADDALGGTNATGRGQYHGEFIAFMNLNAIGELGHFDSPVVGQVGDVLGEHDALMLEVALGFRRNAGWKDILYSIGMVADDGTEFGLPLGTPTEVRMMRDPQDEFDTLTARYLLRQADVPQFLLNANVDLFARITALNTGDGPGGGFTQANIDNVRLWWVPEPSSAALVSLGIVALAGVRRRRR